jgi:hypothetical protein
MMFDARTDWPSTPGFLRLYVADAVHRQALAAGGTSSPACSSATASGGCVTRWATCGSRPVSRTSSP